MNTERFKDKIMVVTGGTSGIGKAVCIRAGAEGAPLSSLDEMKNAERRLKRPLRIREARHCLCAVM